MQAGDGFVQRLVTGEDKGIAFAAYNGVLLGCIKCSKTVSDSNRKLWSGELTPVSASVVSAMREFVKQTNYTGGEN